MDDKMRVVIIEPDKPAQITEIGKNLAAMQTVVGGYIQVISARAMPEGKKLSHDLVLILNEEGKFMRDLHYNFDLWEGRDYVAGTCFVCKEKGDELVGLTEEEAQLVAGLIVREEVE